MTDNQFLINSNIDWELLKKQKISLLNIITVCEDENKDKIAEDLVGILNLIDDVQECAVKSGIGTEEEIFNLSED